MNKILIFDVETNDLPKNYKAPAKDLKNWPRILQLGAVLCDYEGKVLHEFLYLVKPESWKISKGSYETHGISEQYAIENGYPVTKVLKEFVSVMDDADVLIAHNLNFDQKVLAAEMHRTGIAPNTRFRMKYCTMKGTTDLLKIKAKWGYKWPQLSELHYYLFSEDFEGAHDALEDCKATARCVAELIKRKHLNLNNER